MIPEIWYEMLRFVGRKDERFEWQYSEASMAWVYGLVEWSLPHQQNIVIFQILVVTSELVENVVPDIAHLFLQEAIIKSGRVP